MTTCKTICIECVHHNGSSPDASWYDHYCMCPALKRQKEPDPVTGKQRYAIKNDLGNVVFTDDAFPYCLDINHGNCNHFEGGIDVRIS